MRATVEMKAAGTKIDDCKHCAVDVKAVHPGKKDLAANNGVAVWLRRLRRTSSGKAWLVRGTYILYVLYSNYICVNLR